MKEYILVTGASGYIGRNFIRFLIKSGKNVIAVTRNPIAEFSGEKNCVQILCSLNEYESLANKVSGLNIQVFYHFAWSGTSGEDRNNYSLQLRNVKYTCDAAVVAHEMECKRFITTGTITEKVAENILEKDYSAQNLIYGLSKLYAHRLLDVVCKNIGLEYVWARLSNIYGGDNTSGNLISYTLNALKTGNIPSFGPCLQPYNFTHINDVVNALYLLGTTNHVKKEYVVSNGECRVLKEYLQIIENLYEKKLGIGQRLDDGIIFNTEWFKNDDITELGFKPKMSFEKAMMLQKIHGGGG